MTKRQRMRDLSDRDLWHGLLTHWGNVSTAEWTETMIKEQLVFEKFLNEFLRRQVLPIDCCTCQDCMWTAGYLDDLVEND